MFRLPGWPKATIRLQLTVIILVALATILIVGNRVEHWVKEVYSISDLEDLADELNTIAHVLAMSSPEDRQIIMRSAQAAGWDITLAPMSTANAFTQSSSEQNPLIAVTDWLFPPDNDPPLGGWQTFLNDRRVVAAKVDDATIVMTLSLPEPIVTSDFLGRGPHFLLAFVVLMGLFSFFAVRAITAPIQKIVDAAKQADINTSAVVFEEKGTIEIVTLARALNGMRRRIKLMMDARTRALRGIGHDLRTPLTRMKMKVERMPDGSEKEALIADIDRIDGMLTDTLTYLRNDYATEPLELVNIASVLQTICSEFTDLGHAVSYDGPNKLNTECRPVSLTRAVTNLCDNAVKFAHTVVVRLAETPDALVITVDDDGPGIPHDFRERVLEPFFKADGSRSASRGGLGLGLSIVADIARLHEGKLELLPRQPHGLSARISMLRTSPISGQDNANAH